MTSAWLTNVQSPDARLLRPRLFVYRAFVVVLLPARPGAADRLYVEAGTAGGGDGAGWPTAPQTINDALVRATSDTEIWVAEGTYAEAISLTTGVLLYGGFDKSEPTLADREIAAHPSVIDGSAARGGEPAYHVVTIDGALSVTLDGFTITGGAASRPFAPNDRGGGGIEMNHGTLSAINSVISGNVATYGGAIKCWTGDLVTSHCTIAHNAATYPSLPYGAGGIDFGSFSPPAALANTVFYRNSGYGVYSKSARQELSVTNCLFEQNSRGDFFYPIPMQGYLTMTGGDEINRNVDGAVGNVDGEPQFLMGAEGTWTAPPQIVFNAHFATTRTVLTDTAADFAPGALVGSLIAPNTNYTSQALIAANTSTTLEVWGDLADFAVSGAQYQLVDYRVGFGSAAIDQGTSAGVFVDFEGKPRPVDIAQHGVDGTGTEFDVGAFEARAVAGIIVTARELRDHLLGRAALPAAALPFADVNRDGPLNVADMIQLLGGD